MTKKRTTKASPKKPMDSQSRQTGRLPTLSSGTNPLARIENGLDPMGHRASEDLIYESIMRGGGQPFGAPYEIGISSLTERLVKFFKQRSFWRFETFETPRPKSRRNRFTRYGASRFYGSYDPRALYRAARQKSPAGRKEKEG